MKWQERIDSYVKHTGFMQSMFVCDDGTVVGTWVGGNNYQVKSGYYGGYPATYLNRIKGLFPDKEDVLHLFSGRVDLAVLPGDTVDLNKDLAPTYVDDAQTLLNVPLYFYDLILADPPYSVEDAMHYQTTMIKRNVVMKALERVESGAHVVWLDQTLPMYAKSAWKVEARIGFSRSTNHRFRVITVFRRL